MDIQSFPIELTMAKAKTVRTLSYAAIALSALYIIESYLSLAVIIVCMIIPFFGYIPLIFFSSFEFLLFISAMVTSIYAVALASKLLKEISPINMLAEGIAIKGGANTSRIISFIALGLNVLNFLIMLIKIILPMF